MDVMGVTWNELLKEDRHTGGFLLFYCSQMIWNRLENTMHPKQDSSASKSDSCGFDLEGAKVPGF